MKNTGAILLIIGIILTLSAGYTFYTKKKVVDIGKLEITKDEPHTFNWSPLIGIGVIGIGAVLFWQGSRKT